MLASTMETSNAALPTARTPMPLYAPSTAMRLSEAVRATPNAMPRSAGSVTYSTATFSTRVPAPTSATPLSSVIAGRWRTRTSCSFCPPTVALPRVTSAVAPSSGGARMVETVGSAVEPAPSRISCASPGWSSASRSG